MRPPVPLLCALLAAGLGTARAAAPAPNFLPVKEIQRGMKGYGLSVFSGTKIEKFQVEVIGVLKNAMPKQDIILARMSGAGLETTGIIAGMSGSPIYLSVNGEDRLAGAVAYGWSFPKEPVCGITPFENMNAVRESAPPEKAAGGALPRVATNSHEWTRTLEPGQDKSLHLRDASCPFVAIGVPSLGQLDAPLELGGRSLSQVSVAAGPPAGDALPDSAACLYRIQTPLYIGGLAGPAFELACKEFASMGFMPVQGGSAGASADVEGLKLEPGSALAVRFAEGDLDMSGVGTVTAVMGNTVLGFGHPMFGEGRVSVPMATAVVHYCYPSLARSFKLASSVKTVGRLTADMQAAVMGTIGDMPRMIPIEVHLKRADARGDEVYRCKVFDHPMLTSRVAGVFLFNCLLVRGDFPRENTLKFRATVRLAGRPPMAIENVYSGLMSTRSLFDALGDIVSPVALLSNNQFGKVDVEGIQADFEVTAEATTAEIEAVRLERNDYEPGETLRLLVSLRPHKKDLVIQPVELKLPADLPEGTATVMVCDATANERLDQADAPHHYKPEDLDQLVALLREQTPQQRLHVRIKLPERGVAMRGIELPSLPSSMFPIIASAKATGLSLTGKSISASVDTPYVISGTHSLQVLIRSRQTP